ncbi:COP9 signalosome [Polychytrium aggregatum]|uniref:COP9 signalosome n=1 Tax=Polychytrium aggregatum TaxID=110093 RepID=UPI0022FEF38E|nr:COP9 signalosome [Polychytrium aggregatum]KAI9209113.1 COP9 signalosome [Polychytrium aggregatum]
MTFQESATLYETLKKEFGAAKPDLAKCGQILAKLKIQLTGLSFLIPGQQQPNEKEVLLAREVLEIGAQWSIKTGNITAFERYISQLQTYYHDHGPKLPPSQRQYPLLGLNLLRLLSQGKIAEFHTELEMIDPKQLESNIYIKHPLQIEQWLMEGSYNKVWHSRANVPHEDYLFFVDILMETIRNDIASCSEKAYTSLPISDAATLLYLKNEKEVVAFAKEHGWVINDMEKKIYFDVSDIDHGEIRTHKTARQVLGYARELERIV